MAQLRYVNPAVRQADALQRLWGPRAPRVAQQYLADAKRLKRGAQITFWQEVLTALAEQNAAANTDTTRAAS
jgi:hypothetical protein